MMENKKYYWCFIRPLYSLFVFVGLALFGSTISYAQSVTEKLTLQISIPDDRRVGNLMAQNVLTAAYSKLNINIIFVAIPLARNRTLWDSQQIDGMAYRFADSPLINGVKIDIPIVFGEIVVFSNQKKFSVNSYQSLKPYNVGYLAGATILLDRLKDIERKEAAPTTESLFRKLEVGRTDIAVEGRHHQCIVKKFQLKNIKVLEPPLETVIGFHYLHERHISLQKPLENVLRTMQQDGSLRKLQLAAIASFEEKCL